MEDKTSMLVVWGMVYILSIEPIPPKGIGTIMRHFLELDSGDEE